MEPSPLTQNQEADRDKLRYYFSQGYEYISAGLLQYYTLSSSINECIDFGWLVPCAPVGRYQTECYTAGESLKRELTQEPN